MRKKIMASMLTWLCLLVNLEPLVDWLSAMVESDGLVSDGAVWVKKASQVCEWALTEY